MLELAVDSNPTGSSGTSDARDRLAKAIEHAAHYLPAQGPISVFIHHNTLHAFEHLPFEDATQIAAGVFGCEPYLTEVRFGAEFAKGRIETGDLREVLGADLGAAGSVEVAPGVTRADLRLAMMLLPAWTGTPAELRWKVAEDGVPRQRAALWKRCADVVRALPHSEREPEFARLRDLLIRADGTDPDLAVNDLLTRYTAAFVDQGMSRTALPYKDAGFFRGFCQLYACRGATERWQRELAPLCERSSTMDPLASILESLGEFGIAESEWDAFLTATLLSLRGWGGMIHQVELRSDSVHHPIPSGTFVEFLAVRLLLDRAAATHAAREDFGYSGPLPALGDWLDRRASTADVPDAEVRAYEVYRAATAAGLSAEGIAPSFAREVLEFPSLRRRWLFQLAYERRFRIRTLDALAYRVKHPANAPATPRFQLVTCLDDREESFRRHLEEIAPDGVTFGAAGFFAVPMYYRGATDAHFVPLCPIVVTPKNWVTERVDDHAVETHRRTSTRRARFGRVSHGLHLATRTPVVGALLAAGAGALASLPLVARILFPRLTGRIRGTAGKVVRPTLHTTLALERRAEVPGDHNGQLGFNVDEMAAMGERLLRDIGLINGFSRLVFILGHGSLSLNNPHKSAYDCGACGGSPGAPNGRAISHVLNDGRVRTRLADRGILIPPETRFVGGFHNTCDDSVTLFDTDDIPAELRGELDRVRGELRQTCDRNAHERSRRFESCPLTATPADAHKHVEARSEDLAQARPELGHATNAICIVGRRALSRGLYLDRRAFLTSYDPTQDTPDAAILARTLAAVFPVCAGINLEYYFSHVDPWGYGCGTKLPHNITSLIGVMDGAASDLRTGLPWQMTEIHEPVRLLIVIETTAAIFLKLMAGNPGIDGLTKNGWVQVALLHPETGAISVYEAGEFRPYAAGSDPLRRVHASAEWYGGKRDHLEFVEIAPTGGTRA